MIKYQGTRFTAHEEGDVTIIEFTSREKLDYRALDEISLTMYRMLDIQQNLKLLIDLSSVDRITQEFLGMLVNAHRINKLRNGQLRLVGIKSDCLEIFKITKLDRTLKILPDRKAALQSFA